MEESNCLLGSPAAAYERGHDQPSCPLASVALGAADAVRIAAMMTRGEFTGVLERLRALPPSTPELPRLMSRLVIAMARAGMHEDLDKLVLEMLTRFPPRPEITETVLCLAAILGQQGRFESVFPAIEATVASGYCTRIEDLVYRLAHYCRRAGQAGAADCILRTWHQPHAA